MCVLSLLSSAQALPRTPCSRLQECGLSSRACRMKYLSERALLGIGDRPAKGGIDSREQGWADRFLKYAHTKSEHSYFSLSATCPLLCLSIPSSSSFHVFFSLSNCTLNAHLPSALCTAFAFYFPARLCTTWLDVLFFFFLCVCIRTHYSAIE